MEVYGGYGGCDGAAGFFFLFIFIHFGIAVVDDTTKRSGFENRSERIAWIICNFYRRDEK